MEGDAFDSVSVDPLCVFLDTALEAMGFKRLIHHVYVTTEEREGTGC